MVFTKFVEVGRVCLVNYGPEKGKLCTVINVVDGNRALVDGPNPITGVKRQIINFKRLTLTDIKVNVGLHATEKSLKKAFEAEDVLAEFAKSDLAKTIEMRKKRATMNDFDRFKVMLARKAKSKAVKKKLAQLRK
mmetsp:Transcript_11648/g.18955  ORF Transcript_11648/g.18955 Transcript_11648/m.18955 type:complete len:135 (+) Transcript_11648:67-471(+)|eukprot:CAMPEP_0203747252 /NCGR_PEP_ID=MMETSP0098-20131031/2454_1 /ASSEMBLY_ACC=CAM_ASM_000208 /TAXON_ID=96639 /ORGANISM=" , Strain NY0313808BC1" /LENGTH=134 /DNA_ID=CAMNT_0050635619 /DNA_START=88 /DNA_END=492 /DNA_ORIENTATION=+